MKLVTYDDSKVGRVDGDEIVRLDVPDMRAYFERGGADDTTERTPLAEATSRRWRSGPEGPGRRCEVGSPNSD